MEKMVNICKAENVLSLVDAAHSIGHETGINLAEVSPDFWVSSCSKWLYVKRGCALLYVAPRNHSMIQQDLTPSMIIPDEKYSRFQAEFFWSGSTDVVTLMTVRPGEIMFGTSVRQQANIDRKEIALEFRQFLGGEQRIVNYCHSLAVQGGRRLAEILGTEIMCSTGEDPLELVGCMINVALPLPEGLMRAPDVLHNLDEGLLESKVY
ncbi:hypothetical protein D9757_015078 [Collybiopsis confluens]|uniref:Aminotransferase class V domain-containing protein n=1 Tax=Collybiopsis confluens TaxID=2823264 RepID=A0A8H5FNU6_9AGAR|nr:hypothetical protein D9757_015078 [Collybiopsis confluens]